MAKLATQPAKPSLDTLAVERGRCHISAYKNITIAIWVGQADLAAAQAAERVSRRMALRHRAGRSYVAFVLDGLPGPTADAMPVFAKLMGQSKDLACLAYVLEGSGFWASGLRGMINNSHREAGATSRLKIATSVDQLVDWLSQHHAQATGVAITPAEWSEVLLAARKRGESARD